MRAPLFASLFTVALLGACADEPDDHVHFVGPQGVAIDRVDDEGHDHDHDGLVEKSTCNTRWIPSAAVQSAGRNQSVRYDGAGSRCNGGATSGALELAREVRSRFGGLINRRVSGDGVQIYACRSVRGRTSPSVHGDGRALDIFIPTGRGGAADNGAGDRVAAWFIQNAEAIGVQMIIWDRTTWRPGGTGHRCYGGAHPHNDHLHVEITRAAAAKQTPFFRGARPEPPPVEPPPPARADAWIGHACDDDADCGFTVQGARGRCFDDHGGAGFCTLECAGYCPDRTGEATTFCTPSEDLGGRAGTGSCAAKSSRANGFCADAPGLEQRSVNRFIGRSGARPGTATVCAPPLRAPPPEAPEEEEDEEAEVEPPPPPATNVCGVPGLETGDNGDRCGGVADNTWRCACSDRFDTVISQVCRGGRWLTYHTNPRDCARCDGRYTSGCE